LDLGGLLAGDRIGDRSGYVAVAVVCDQTQQSLEFASIDGGGVELEGNPASIKSISECIHLSNAISLSSCFSRISLSGSRRQLSIRKKERKGDSDEPDAPLLLERELAVGEGDVVICTPPPMPEVSPPSAQSLLAGRHRILVTGGAGFGLRPTASTAARFRS